MLRPRGAKLISAFFKQSVSDFDIDLGLLVGSQLILRDVCVEVLETGCLAKAHKLIVNEAVSEWVELVDVGRNLLACGGHIGRDKGVSAKRNADGEDAISNKDVRSVDERPEGVEAVISGDNIFSDAVSVSTRSCGRRQNRR